MLEKRTAFFRGGWSSDELVRGDEAGDSVTGPGPRLGSGIKRDMRTRRDVLLRSESCGVEGAVEVTSVDDDETKPGFFRDERAGGGGRGTGLCVGWGWDAGAGYFAGPRRCGVRERWRPMAICSTVGRGAVAS